MYRNNDIDILQKNILNIEKEANKEYKNKFEPKIEESKVIFDIVLDYVKKNKKIIYGGFAQDKLIKMKNKNDFIYEENEINDIEFYSSEPLKDLHELCDIIYNKTKINTSGKNAQHEGSFSIFVNFIQYCDITYQPKNINNNAPYILYNGLRLIHPYFIINDFYRIFTDPMTSYRILNKTFNRYNKIIKYYPFETKNKNITFEKNNDKILNIIRKKIIHNSKLIVIGNYAYNYYLKKNKDTNLINIDYYELISIDYNNDLNNILNKLQKLFDNKITVNKYVKFFQFFDEKTDFLYNDKIILRLYNNNNRCIVYRESKKKKCYFGTTQLVILYLLSNYHYYLINKNNIANNYINMINNLNKTRNNYLDKNNLTILDKTPFQEFIIKCIGNTIEPFRMHRLKLIKDKHKILYNYEPSKNIKEPENRIFDNESGNIILKK
jgi:hypothetical protein